MRQDIQTDILTFRLGSEKLALPAEYLREILEVVPITRVPQSGKFATGLINVRGVVVPLADLRVALRIPRSPATEDTRILVLDVRVGDEKSTVAVPGHGFETARCADHAAILTPVAASGSRVFCSALI